MATAKILISVPTNGNPAQIYEQIAAYNAAMSGNCTHVVHVSRDAAQSGAMAESGALRLSSFENVLLNDRHYFSRTPSILGIHVMNVEFAVRRGIAFDYVYLHTASDLPFRRGLNVHIAQHDFGMGPSRRVDTTKQNGWNPAVADHRDIHALTSFFGPDAAIYTTRTEGFFARRDLFFEVMWYAKVHVPFERENIWRGNYPFEEYLLPTVVEHVLGKRDLRRTRHAVVTTTSDRSFGLKTREPVNEQHIPILEKLDPAIFAFKFVPTDLTSPVRAWVRAQLGYGLPTQ
ncbi:hypothetical protein SAMN05444678_1307 [Sphingomonas sp. YR710]|uniref:hypothetical protein n=1 Tax=Sphingomonas sp. YR710 TaxID=1882773 RepID=UPI0008887933|nr:hypothetical protein [Sphingomonas sp. YR710]SDD88269.1 hypothetical protein SAMN05444678_1307 [Sphingomonas sp. YR710]